MQLLVATLCDSASENQGKLNIIGAFDTIAAQTFPTGFACTLALRFCFTAEDHGSHPFSIHLADDSAPSEAPAPGDSKMDVNMPPGTTGFSTQNMISPIQGTIQKAGAYHFDVYFDGKVLASIPFRVISQDNLVPPAQT